jgi:hypothetical protein
MGARRFSTCSARGGEDLAVHAREPARRHRSCTRIEVWDGYVRLLVIGLGPAGLDGVGLD